MNILKPVKLAVEALGKEDSNLLTSEGIFQFLFETINENRSSLAKELLSALKSRFNARRNKQIVSVIQFLQNPQILKSNISFEELNLCSKTEILKTIKDIMNKHFQKDVISEEEQNCSEITTVATEISQPQNTTLLDKLQQNVASRFKTMTINKE